MRRMLLMSVLSGAALVVLAVSYVALRGDSSSVQTATLPNVTAADRENIGLTVTDAQGDLGAALISSDVAKATTLQDEAEGARVLSVDLVRLKRAAETRDNLVWAVSLDPSSISALPFLGDGPLPSAYTQPASRVRFAIVFVDARTGEFVWRWEMDDFVDNTTDD